MTKQEIFDKVVKHLGKQRAKSTGSLLGCRYRGDQGRSCAIGCLIPDAKYRSYLEGNPPDDPFVQKAAGLRKTQLLLAGALVAVHDSCNVSEWPKYLVVVAEVHKLNPSKIKRAFK